MKEIDLDYIYSNYDEIIKQEQVAFCNPIEVLKVENSCLISKDGTKYLDFTANLDLQPFGYFLQNNGQNSFVVNSKLVNINHPNNIYDYFGFKNINFLNSMEDNYKFLNNYIKHEENSDKDKVLLSCDIKTKKYFDEKIGQIPLNNVSILKTMFTKKVGAIIVQPVQISDNVEFADIEFLKMAKELATKNEAKFVMDFSNVSPFRVGKVFNDFLTIKPDLLLLSNGLANGLPVSIICSDEKIDELENKASSFVIEVMNSIFEPNNLSDVLNQIKDISEKIKNGLEQIQEKHVSIGNVEIKGLYIMFDVDFNAYEFVQKCFDKGLILTAVSITKVVLTPSFNITDKEINDGLSVIKEVTSNMGYFDKI